MLRGTPFKNLVMALQKGEACFAVKMMKLQVSDFYDSKCSFV